MIRKIVRKIGKIHKTKKINPYARINWEKAGVLFKKVTPPQRKGSFPSVKQLLPIIAAAGALGLIFAFPGAAPAIGGLVIAGEKYQRWKTKNILNQLKKQKYVTIKQNDDETVTVKITKDGMVHALTYQLDNMKLKIPKKWDKKWRVITFDIPEKYKKVRDIFRTRLTQMGLFRLQDSVYVSPYSCFSEVEFLRELYGVSFTVRYLVVVEIDDDRLLKEYFELN